MSFKEQNLSKLASYSDLFDRLLDVTLLVDSKTHEIVAANPQAERTLEVPGDQLLGKQIFDLIKAEQLQEFKKFMRRASRKYYPSRMVCNWLSSSGKAYVMEVMLCGLKLTNEREVLQVVARDITYQSQIEQSLRELTITDELTQIFNVRHFKNAIQEEHLRSVRHSRPYAVILCDVDHFKNYNDTNGHPAGDKLLKELAQLLKAVMRSTDMVARYGGEEFIMLCRESDAASLVGMAERILEKVRNHPFDHREKQPLGHVSMSMGISSYPHDGQTPEQVIINADGALYASKRGGRDRFTIYSSAINGKKIKAA